MKVGTLKIEMCNDCPAYEWAGESIREGDMGMLCAFGVFCRDYSDKKEIPENCPLKEIDKSK